MAARDRKKMTVNDLESVNGLYDRKFWNFLLASYEGIKALIDGGWVLNRHERESKDNYDRRVEEAYGLGYSGSVIDLFNFYLFKGNVKREMGTLAKDPQWEMFEKDCNLYGDNFLVWLLESQRWAGVMGHVGILVDKSSTDLNTPAAEIAAQVYPYVARYFPQNILDWEYERDEHNRPVLSYVKVRDDDMRYRLWTREWWATYTIPDDIAAGSAHTAEDVDTGQVRGGSAGSNEEDKPTIDSEADGDNPLGEVPFLWLYNIKSKTRPIGISDIKDVAYIDGSIIRNLSGGEEVLSYGAFPMMRKPMQEAGAGPQSKGADDEAGPSAILEFDPEKGEEGKPDWLESKVTEPVDAILKWIQLKVSEIYRTTNIGGMAATEIQEAPRSGTALKAEFQLLNGKLVSKGNNVEETELALKRLWCKWQRKEAIIDDIHVEWPETYDVANLAEDLANALTAKTVVNSQTFIVEVQKTIARGMLPNADNKLLSTIDKEIEEETKKKEEAGPPIVPGVPPGGDLVPLPAPGAIGQPPGQTGTGGDT
ncbi:hypothetical protein LCGC14_0790880 [marine sediment metagenome]|uniref:Portal protein n=1 Tax=marine sediment metagenome TaxID=412755 RepID=A0A0F9SCH3_9ZZZZ